MIPSAFEGLARHEHSEELWKLLDYLSVRYKSGQRAVLGRKRKLSHLFVVV